MPATSLDARSRAALIRLLVAPRWEVLPLRSSLERTALLPVGATVTVTASPGRPIEATCDLSQELQARGFQVVAHLAARMIRDRRHLRTLLDSLRAGGVNGAFVIGGDAQLSGDFPDALSLLREMVELGHPMGEIGIAVYPQGHPSIPSDHLLAALTEKAPYAAYMTTQLCFDVVAIRAWLLARRAEGVSLPMHLGIPGALQVHRLLDVSARIGVTDAGRFVLRHGALVGRLLRPRGYRPDALLAGLGSLIADPEADIRQLHLFTFNQVGPTAAWRTSYLSRLAVEAG